MTLSDLTPHKVVDRIDFAINVDVQNTVLKQ
jgi:hypothetical protein